jgi:hypothetical protein
MRTPELEARHSASAIISEMMLEVCAAMLEGYNGGKTNFAAVWPEWQVIMVIRLNDHRALPPLSVNKIAHITNVSRRNVDRLIANLIAHGVIKKSGTGYIGEDMYLYERLTASYFKRVVTAIDVAAYRLSKLPKP